MEACVCLLRRPGKISNNPWRGQLSHQCMVWWAHGLLQKEGWTMSYGRTRQRKGRPPFLSNVDDLWVQKLLTWWKISLYKYIILFDNVPLIFWIWAEFEQFLVMWTKTCWSYDVQAYDALFEHWYSATWVTLIYLVLLLLMDDYVMHPVPLWDERWT